jgi:BCD family chlorophyll transporter-like MFS transporter
MGTLIQFGGLAIMPFALLVLSGTATNAPPLAGEIGAALAFLLVGVGLHTTQTAGLALATDLAPEHARPRVVALLYVMLLVGMMLSALTFGVLLEDFSHIKLIQIIQGAALLTMALNIAALWKQEARVPEKTASDVPRPSFREAWSDFAGGGRAGRLLVVVGLGTAAFSMQDILLEPYGGEILDLSVAATTALTAILAAGTLGGFAWAARALSKGGDPYLLASVGTLVGIVAFSMVIFADPLGSATLFRAGTLGIGFGGGLFAVGTMSAAMAMSEGGKSGLALGAWGAVQATAAGGSIAIGGAMRDLFSGWAVSGQLGPGLTSAAVGYSVVYHVEIAFLFMTLVAVGPMVQFGRRRSDSPARFGLAEMPN